MGEVEVDHGNGGLGSGVRAKKAFGGMKNHVFVFTKQSKGGFVMNQDQALSAESHFNRWRTEHLPLNQKTLIDESKLQKCFPTDAVGTSEFADDDVLEGYSRLVDEEQTLSGDKVLPFPLEFHSSLTESMLSVFEAEVLVAMRPYGGECFKAVLRKRCWGVGICNSQEHKKLIRDRLMEYARQMHLVDFKDAPQKPRELIAWESKRRSSDQIAPVGFPLKLSDSPGPVADPQEAGSPAATVPTDAGLTPQTTAPPASKTKLFAFGSAML
jgi:hypothetical protein